MTFGPAAEERPLMGATAACAGAGRRAFGRLDQTLRLVLPAQGTGEVRVFYKYRAEIYKAFLAGAAKLGFTDRI